jgi:hypothetical protein
MSAPKHDIVISDVRTMGRFYRTLTALTSIVVLPVGIGIVAASDAMQWAGFVGGMVILLAFAHSDNSRHTFKTTDEARAFLDKIDRGEA